MTTQVMGILLWILGILVTGFGAGLTAGLTLARRWRRQKDMERRTTCNDI